MSDQIKDKVKQYVDDINSGDIQLLQIVESLGLELASDDVDKRKNSTLLLTEILRNLDGNVLPGKEVTVLVSFFCDRLKDHHSVQPIVLQGMAKLSEFPSLTSEDIMRVYRAINNELHIQSLSQKERRPVYEMTSYLLTHRLQDLQEIGSDFVFIYIQMMDGEKDPRNLVLGFQIVQILGQHFPLGVFAEDLFEVVACYFPIEFTPPPNDPHGITKEELVIGLRKCLASTQRFAEYCLPMLLEKITSSIQTAKIEGFKTLGFCCDSYGAYSLKEYLGSLWSAAEREVIASLSDTLEKSALDALSSIVNTLSTEAVQKGKTTLINAFLKECFQDMQRHLMEADVKLLPAMGKLLAGLASGSPEACQIMLDLSVPIVTSQFHKHDRLAVKQCYVEILLALIKTAKLTSIGEESPLLKYKDSLLGIFQSLLSDSQTELRSRAVSGLVGLLSSGDLVTASERALIATQFVDLVLYDNEESVRSETTIALTYLSTAYPDLVLDKVFPTLSSKLQNETMEVCEEGGGDAKREPTKEETLKVLVAISNNLQIIESSVSLLLSYLESLETEEPNATQMETKAVPTCESLYTIVNCNCKDSSAYHYFYEKVLPHCLRLCISRAASSKESCQTEQTQSHILCETQIVYLVAKVIRCISCQANENQSQDLMDLAFNLFIKNDASKVGCDLLYTVKASSWEQQAQLVILFSAIVSSLPASVKVPEVDQMKELLLSLALEGNSQSIRTAAAQCLGAYYNKYNSVPNMDGSCTLASVHQDKGRSLEERRRALSALMWVVKATVLAALPQQTQHINYLLEYLQDSQFSDVIADGFYVILGESDAVMTSEQHADVKLMYRQRFFHMILPRLIKQFNSVDDAVKPHHLTALSYLMRFVPKQVLLSELPPIIPMLLKSMDVSDQPSLWLSTLNTCYDLLCDAPDAFHSHVPDLISRLCKLMLYKPNMKVRIAATQCIGIMSSFTPHLVLPHKKTVLRQLRALLDDHKRLVRLEATKASSEWHLLGEPGKS